MRIVHITHTSDPNDPAFVHAVALAARAEAELVTIHVPEPGAPFMNLPDASVLLLRWGMPPAGVAHERMLPPYDESIEESLLGAISGLKPELVVASTHARTGLGRILFASIAEGVARNLQAPALLLPLDCEPFVDAGSGALRLQRLLVPVATASDAQRAVRAALALAHMADAERCDLELLHVGPGNPFPELELPSGVRITLQLARGTVEHAVAKRAAELHPDVIVMVTSGHNSAGDVLLASHTERVLHRCRRPLLWVPAAARRE
jgi:nucleotide-binding universal stress UspA family protein